MRGCGAVGFAKGGEFVVSDKAGLFGKNLVAGLHE
jgi:hypothetical protein